MPAMPLTPCWPPPVITSISCLDGWSACCLDSWRLKMPRSPFNGSENRKLHGRLSSSAVPSKFRLTIHTPDQAEQWIDADSNCKMLIYNAGGDSIAGSETMQRIKVLRALAADVPLVIFSERESREEIISALNVGAQGVVYAGTSADLAVQAFSVILNGGYIFPS